MRAGVNDDRIAQLETRLLFHLPHRGIDDALVRIDHPRDQAVRERIVAAHQGAGPHFVHQDNRIAIRIVSKHADRIAALHDFPDQALRSSFVLLDLELVAIQAEKARVQRRNALDDDFRFAAHDFSSTRGHLAHEGLRRPSGESPHVDI